MALLVFANQSLLEKLNSMFLDKSRLVSLFIVAFYLIFTFSYSDLNGQNTFRLILLLVLALACIWFGDELGWVNKRMGSLSNRYKN